MIDWQDLHHSDLSVSQLYALLQLRCAVFVVEQNCPYQDIDGDDLEGENRHILGWHNGTLVAYARILKSDDELQPVVIGRVIVSEALRGEKIGQQLMSKALESVLAAGRRSRFIWGRRRIYKTFMGNLVSSL